MKRILDESELQALSEEYPTLDGRQAPLLIKLLWDLRHFQEDLMLLPLHKLEPLMRQVWDIDQAIALQILQLVADNKKVSMVLTVT